MKIKPLLFKIARSRFAELFIGFAFAYLTRLMPLDRLFENDRVIIFKHPVPSWQTHWLGAPKKRLRSFTALDFEDNETREIILAVYEGLVKTAVSSNLPSFSIFVNGGSYQDVPQIHFHLINGPTTSGQQWEPEKIVPPTSNAQITRFEHAIAYLNPIPESKFHCIITSQNLTDSLQTIDFAQLEVRWNITAIFQLAQQLITQHAPSGYRLQTNITPTPNTPPTFHLLT